MEHSGGIGGYSVLWRELWEQSGQAAFESRLLQYNHEDCLALRSLHDFIADVIERTPGNASEQYIVRTDELPKSPTKWPTYGRDVFQLREFERINECAYFDYQREHVDKDTAAVGTPPAKALRRNGQNGKWRLMDDLVDELFLLHPIVLMCKFNTSGFVVNN